MRKPSIAPRAYSHTPTPLTSLPDTRTLAPGIQLTADSRDVDIPTSFSSSRTARVRPETSIRPAAPVTCSGNSQKARADMARASD